jgi:hypothetical protein
MKARKLPTACHMCKVSGWAALDCMIILATFACLLAVITVTSPFNYSYSAGFIVFTAGIILVFNHVFGVYRRIWTTSSGHEDSGILKAGASATVIAHFTLEVV